MPQPLSRITNGQRIGYENSLPFDNPMICAAALQIISSWSNLDSQVIGTFGVMFPESIEILANRYIQYSAQSPKKSMIDALAIAGLNERELDVFEKLLRKKEAVYKLRNPIAHWVLGHSDSYPELLIATDAKEYIRFDAKWRSVTNKMSAGEGTPSDLDEALLRLLNSSQAYDLEELNRISGQIADTAKLFVEFNFLLGVRIRDNDRKWHAEKFARLSQMLG